MNALALVMYRNPAEEFLWEYVYPWGAIVLIALFVVFLVWTALYTFVDWVWKKWEKRK